jgi:hypothetical protein
LHIKRASMKRTFETILNIVKKKKSRERTFTNKIKNP